MDTKKLIRVLTVDDQANWRELIKAILKEDGCDVLTATSYSQAAEIIEAWDSTWSSWTLSR